MTLCVAWVRKRKREESLYLIADSRFTCGDVYDGCPKLFPLERGDCALACAGNTLYSLPIANHIQRSIALNIKNSTRALDFCDLCHGIVDIANRCLMDVSEVWGSEKDKGPDFQMIFAGYSVLKGKFDVRIIEYDPESESMVSRKASYLQRRPYAIIGDHDADNDRVKQFRADMFRALDGSKEIDMEPLDVLMKYINNEDIRSIGGNPQMLKITKFMQILPIGFYKEDADGIGNISYYGRNLLKYETFPYPIIDIRTKEQFYMKGVLEKFKRVHEKTEPLEVFTKMGV